MGQACYVQRMTSVVIFAMGVPHAYPGSFGNEHSSVWPMVVFFVGIVLLLFEYGYVKWKTHRNESKPEESLTEPTATAMQCSYCGRQNDLNAASCKECGTPFPKLATLPDTLPKIEADSA